MSLTLGDPWAPQGLGQGEAWLTGSGALRPGQWFRAQDTQRGRAGAGLPEGNRMAAGHQGREGLQLPDGWTVGQEAVGLPACYWPRAVIGGECGPGYWGQLADSDRNGCWGPLPLPAQWWGPAGLWVGGREHGGWG